ncbi:MAG: hypothetical protein M1825_000392 [Sarcosagium campestre]|nr:MAG: hypothetical protein M1825_000392 [Sarcosagium campestre]
MATPRSTPAIESPYLRSLIAGGIAGTTVDLSLYPIDTLKTRLQSSSGFRPSGGFTGVYRGVGSALVGSAPGAALFFVTYDGVKRFLADQHRGNSYTGPRNRWTEPLEQMGAASLAEIAACAVRVPTEVVKQRAQASLYPSSWSALRHILARRAEVGVGVRGVWRELYRGWNITVMRELPFTVIQFPLWEGMKQWRRRRRRTTGVIDNPDGNNKGNGQDDVVESALFGSISGAIAAGITTPLDVLKTRLMLSTDRQRVVPLLSRILAESGPRAFLAGIGPRVLWISAGGAIFLGSYQWASNLLDSS